MKRCLFSFLIILLPTLVFSNEYSGTLLRVIDGDTFVFQESEGTLKIRMDGIDAL